MELAFRLVPISISWICALVGAAAVVTVTVLVVANREDRRGPPREP
jgi:hypothetical protein